MNQSKLPRGTAGISWDPACGYSEEEWKSFSKSKRWRLRNPEKSRAATKNWVNKNPECRNSITRRSKLLKSFGLTPEDYDNMLNKQNGCCAICGTDRPTGKWKVFAVDHCHITGKIRGLLCNECNRGMGLLRDSADICMKASEYLSNHDIKTAHEKLPTEPIP